jgi:hypothetical protein
MDSMDVIALAQNGHMNARNKHINIHYHYICKAVSSNLIALHYTVTNDMVADALTKVLPYKKLVYFCDFMSLFRLEEKCQYTRSPHPTIE